MITDPLDLEYAAASADLRAWFRRKITRYLAPVVQGPKGNKVMGSSVKPFPQERPANIAPRELKPFGENAAARRKTPQRKQRAPGRGRGYKKIEGLSPEAAGALILKGESLKEIALKLHCGVRTVQSHLIELRKTSAEYCAAEALLKQCPTCDHAKLTHQRMCKACRRKSEPCGVTGCENLAKSKGLCNKHYCERRRSEEMPLLAPTVPLPCVGGPWEARPCP